MGELPETSEAGVEAWRARGFTHLHPIIPPQVVADPTRLFAWARKQRPPITDEAVARARWTRIFGGKCPGALSEYGRWFGLNVQKRGTHDNRQLAEAMRLAWQAGAGVGVLGRYWPCLDVDVTNEDKARVLRWMINEIWPDCAVRIGRAPKFAMPFRWGAGWGGAAKLTLPVAWRGKMISERIEIIGVGYQWVLDGVHGGTGAPYRWDGLGGAGRPHAAQLPVLGVQGLKDLMRALRAAVGVPGPQGAVTGQWHATVGWRALEERDTAGQQPGQERAQLLRELRGPETMVRQLVRLIPNNGGIHYEHYAAMMHAIKGASGGEDWGLETWLGWCAGYPGDRVETNLDKWADLSTSGVRIGVDWLIKKAPISQGDKARYLMERIRWQRDQQAQQGDPS